MRRIKKVLIVITLLAFLMGTVIQAGVSFDTASSWAVEELTLADTNGFVTDQIGEDFSQNITREEFCEIAVALYDKLGGSQDLAKTSTFTDTNNPYVIKANNAEIVFGTNSEQTLFTPNGYLTRQECCVMINRAMQQSGALYSEDYTWQKNYVDTDSIADWAYQAVNLLNAFGIINGMGEKIAPLGTLTREQAVIMLNRAYIKLTAANDLVLGKTYEGTLDKTDVISLNYDASEGEVLRINLEGDEGISVNIYTILQFDEQEMLYGQGLANNRFIISENAAGALHITLTAESDDLSYRLTITKE